MKRTIKAQNSDQEHDPEHQVPDAPATSRQPRRGRSVEKADEGTKQEPDLLERIDSWFASQGREPFKFQRQVWQAMRRGQSGLLHAGTGSGKTYACWLGALHVCEQRKQMDKAGLKVLWITPMRALAQDTFRALQSSSQALCAHWSVQTRTSDTQASVRARQAKTWPDALITTPESLSLMLTKADASARLANLQVVIVDEWHELLGSKRGVQVQLALARLMRWNPGLLVWGMSATLGNLEHALQALVPRRALEPSERPQKITEGASPGESSCRADGPCLICAPVSRSPIIDVILPQPLPRFARAGQMGYAMAGILARRILQASTSLVFVNTRGQAERWYQALLEAEPGLAGLIALHHGSLDGSVRQWVEQGLVQGHLKAVVCTSSLDLGVDFAAVEQVFQIGSTQGVARLLQRAGRSGHTPGGQPRIGLVPTHALEALEAVAIHDAVKAQAIESRFSPIAPMDVLVQHLVTVGLGGGFEPQALYEEIRQTWSYRTLDQNAWAWALAFVSTGGSSLGAYPDYHRVVPGGRADDSKEESTNPTTDTLWRVIDRRLALRHRLNIGTIVSDAMLQVRYWSRGSPGAGVGQVEEAFVARIKPGECFVLGGKVLELVRVQDMTVYVRRAQSSRAAIPRWEGSNLSLSGELTQAMVMRLDSYRKASLEAPTTESANQTLPVTDVRRSASRPSLRTITHDVCTPAQAWRRLTPLLATQQAMSGLPSHERLLVEQMHSRDGWHWFIYPMAGRRVHLALASLLAWRLAQREARSFSFSVNDYGLELLCNQPLDAKTDLDAALLSSENLETDLLASVNASELAQRQFREIARVAGLVFQGFPNQKKSARQVQASSQLFYKVFAQYDPQNLLLQQASSEVMTQTFDMARLVDILQRLRSQAMEVRTIEHFTPFGFGLTVQRLAQRLSSEKLAERVARMLREVNALDDLESTPGEQGVQDPYNDHDTRAPRRSRASRKAQALKPSRPSDLWSSR